MPKLKPKLLVVLIVAVFAVTMAGLGAGWKWAQPPSTMGRVAGWTWDVRAASFPSRTVHRHHHP